MSRSEQIYKYTASKLGYLQRISDTGEGRRILANLRRGVGKKPGELPELWGMIFDKIPEELIGDRYTSDAEWAIYTALTLYALHRQGSDKDMHQADISVGRAAARLVKHEDDEKRILNRLNLVATATDPEDLAYHLRGIVQLLKSEDIPLDHAKLSRELYLFHNKEIAANIKLSWGRDFYRERNRSAEKENGNG